MVSFALATALFIEESTVKIHVRKIIGKLHVRNQLQAVALAIEKGLIPNETEADTQAGVLYQECVPREGLICSELGRIKGEVLRSNQRKRDATCPITAGASLTGG